MIDLQNNLTLRHIRLSYEFFPRRWVGLDFQLIPTVGTQVTGSADEFRVFTLQWHEDNAGDGSVVDFLIGKSAAEVKAAILQQWQAYRADADSVNAQLRTLFDYVASVGIR